LLSKDDNIKKNKNIPVRFFMSGYSGLSNGKLKNKIALYYLPNYDLTHNH
jgi:hypothetical protein